MEVSYLSVDSSMLITTLFKLNESHECGKSKIICRDCDVFKDMKMNLFFSYFIFSVVYKYMSVEEETVALKVTRNDYALKFDLKYKNLYHRACNPPDSIVRGSEGKCRISLENFCIQMFKPTYISL